MTTIHASTSNPNCILAVICMTAVVWLLAGPALAEAGGSAAAPAAPASLRDLDPLIAPRPSRPAVAVPRIDVRTPETKLVAPLRDKLAKTLAEERLRVLVTLHGPAPKHLDSAARKAAQVAEISASAHRFVDQAKPLGFSTVRGYSLFPIVVGEIAARQLDKLASIPSVLWIEEDVEQTISRLEGGALLRADALATHLGATGAGIGIAIVDTGVDWNHPELFGKVVAHGDFTGTTGTGLDDEGHGTSAAGIAAGRYHGMARDAHVWAIKVLSAAGVGAQSQTIAGLQAILDSHTSFGGVHVVNMSLGGGGPYDFFCDEVFPSYALAVSALHDAGIIVLAASGNDGFKNGISRPACLIDAYSVGAVYDSDIGWGFGSDCIDLATYPDRVTCYSNSGLFLDFLAPSNCATTPGLGSGYETCFNGTSAASPYVAGVAAQLLSLAPGRSPAELAFALWWTGEFIIDPANGLIHPRVDALRAAEHLAVIFDDGFELGTLDAWSSGSAFGDEIRGGPSTRSTPTGGVEADAEARHLGVP